MAKDSAGKLETEYELPLGIILPFYLSHLETVNKLWITLKKTDKHRNEDEVVEILEGLLKNESSLTPDNSPIVGKIYCARFTEDGRLYRARVERLNPDQTADVVFVDYGNRDTCKELYHLKLELGSFQPAAHCVHVLVSLGVEDSSHNRLEMERMLSEADCKVILTKDGDQHFGQLFLNGEEIDFTSLDQTNNNVCGFSPESAAVKASAPVGKVGVPPSLKLGVPMDVDVLSVASVHSVWVTIRRDHPALEELMAKIGIADDKGNLPVLLSPEVNSLWLARFSEDDTLYRVRIEGKSDNTLVVRYIDYGNCENKKEGEIYEITTELADILPFCFPVKITALSGCEDNEANRQILDDLLCEGTIVLTLDSQTSGDLTVNGEPVNSNVFPRTLNEEIPLVESDSTKIKAQVGEPVEVEVIPLESIHKVWVTRTDASPALDELMSKMDLLNKNGNLTLLTNPGVDSLCIARFTEDGTLYRGRLEGRSDNTLVVRYIDYGNSENKKEDEIYEIPTELVVLPPFCFPVKITALSGCEDNEANRQILDDLLSEGTIVLTLDSQTSGDFTVNAEAVDSSVFSLKGSSGIPDKDSSGIPDKDSSGIRENQSKEISANKSSEMHKKEVKALEEDKGKRRKVEDGKELVVPWTPAQTRLAEQRQSTQVHQRTGHGGRGASDARVQTGVEQHGQEMGTKGSNLSPKKTNPLEVVKSPSVIKTSRANIGVPLSVEVNPVASIHTVWVSTRDRFEELDLLMSKLKEHHENGRLHVLKNQLVGSLCIARFTEDRTLYRARIEEKMEDNRLLVRYIDYGNTEIKTESEMLDIPEELAAPAPFCFHVKTTALAGCVDSEANARILDGLLSQGCIALVMDSPTSGDFTVDGRSVDSSIFPTPINESKSKAVPELESQGVLKATLTHVDTVTSIWATPVQYQVALDTLMDQISNIAPGLPTMATCSVGDLGIARFSDGLHYRCRVLEAGPDTRVRILFIDYGNSEWRSAEDFLQIPESLSRLPALVLNFNVRKLKFADNLENRAIMQEVCDAEGSIDLVYRTVPGGLQCKLSPELVSKLVLRKVFYNDQVKSPESETSITKSPIKGVNGTILTSPEAPAESQVVRDVSPPPSTVPSGLSGLLTPSSPTLCTTAGSTKAWGDASGPPQRGEGQDTQLKEVGIRLAAAIPVQSFGDRGDYLCPEVPLTPASSEDHFSPRVPIEASTTSHMNRFPPEVPHASTAGIYFDFEAYSGTLDHKIGCNANDLSELSDQSTTLSGSMELQRRLKEGDQVLGQRLVEMLVLDPVLYFNHSRATYLVQSLLPTLNKVELIRISQSIGNRFSQVAENKCGTHVLQRLLSFNDPDVSKMLSRSLMLIKNMPVFLSNVHSSHVAQACLCLMTDKETMTFIVSSILPHIIKLANGTASTFFLQKLIPFMVEKKFTDVNLIMNGVMNNMTELAFNTNGTRIVQLVLSKASKAHLKKAADWMIGSIRFIYKSRDAVFSCVAILDQIIARAESEEWSKVLEVFINVLLNEKEGGNRPIFVSSALDPAGYKICVLLFKIIRGPIREELIANVSKYYQELEKSAGGDTVIRAMQSTTVKPVHIE